jgi:hypothetical protein
LEKETRSSKGAVKSTTSTFKPVREIRTCKCCDQHPIYFWNLTTCGVGKAPVPSFHCRPSSDGISTG